MTRLARPGVNHILTHFRVECYRIVMWAMRGQPDDAVAGKQRVVAGSVSLTPVKMTEEG